MLKAISTHIFLRQRLHPGLLDVLMRGGAQGVELFAARQHFDYTNRSHIRELSDWFRANPVEARSMHAPMFPDLEMGRAGAPPVNVVHAEKSRRIDAMDEIKRALEVAEQIPFGFLILHMGERGDGWDGRVLEYAITALEHLRAFANPLGVKLLIENIPNEVTRPANILEILQVGHFSDIGVCLDVGHANFGEGVAAALSVLKDHIRSTHLHDNQGTRDEHLWPGDGTIDWDATIAELKTAKHQPAALLEIQYTLDEPPETVIAKARKTFERFGL